MAHLIYFKKVWLNFNVRSKAIDEYTNARAVYDTLSLFSIRLSSVS